MFHNPDETLARPLDAVAGINLHAHCVTDDGPAIRLTVQCYPADRDHCILVVVFKKLSIGTVSFKCQ